MSILGLVRGPDKTVPTPAEDWHTVKVDVIIPALNEEKNIAICLDSLSRQTLKPRQVLLVDDGSRDNTVKYAKDYAGTCGLNLQVIQRSAPIGKTPTLKRQARELDSDVEFILDSDTVLISPNYIERTVEELYKAAGIGSACGCLLSLSPKNRKSYLAEPGMKKFFEINPDAVMKVKRSFIGKIQREITSIYRDCLYTFLQKFVYRGQMAFFGSITHPVGCAVAYRRKYIEELFAKYEPLLGDDLTNSEDIFIGFALINHGYRNIQVPDILCRSEEPEAKRVPHQLYMWSSSFLQSCYYFNDILTSPFKSLKRWRHNWKFKHSEEGRKIMNMRKIQEPYREPFGDSFTALYGRPIGWSIFMSAVEKIVFPVALLMMIAAQMWEALWVTLLAETVIALTVLTIVAPTRHKLEFLVKGIAVTPLRYGLLLYDLTTIYRFTVDIWLRKNRSWRK